MDSEELEQNILKLIERKEDENGALKKILKAMEQEEQKRKKSKTTKQ